MRSPAKLCAGLLFGTLLLCASPVSAQTELRWKFQPGQIFHHTLTQESTVSAMIGGQPLDSTSSLTVDNVWTVNDLEPDGAAELSQTTSRIRMKMSSPGGMMEIDTSGAEEPKDILGKRIAASLKALTQAKVTFSLSPQGEVSDVQISAPEGKNAGGADQFSQMLGKDGIVSLVKQSIYPLPREPVQKGSSWTNKMEMDVPMLGKVSTDATLTYEGQTRVAGKALEQIKVVTKTAVAQKQGGTQFAQLSIKEQSDDGTMYFDNAAGRLSHVDSVQHLTLNVAIAGQNVSQTVKTVRKAVLKPAEE